MVETTKAAKAVAPAQCCWMKSGRNASNESGFTDEVGVPLAEADGNTTLYKDLSSVISIRGRKG
jgi:hypothetical protein